MLRRRKWVQILASLWRMSSDAKSGSDEVFGEWESPVRAILS